MNNFTNRISIQFFIYISNQDLLSTLKTKIGFGETNFQRDNLLELHKFWQV